MQLSLNRSGVLAAVCLATVAGVAAEGKAQAVRTFVSGSGSDMGTCNRPNPCRSFAYAVTQTASAGEVVVLDSAGYGAVTITQPVTITNPGGVEAAISAPQNGNAITITASGGVVSLRGLTLEGAGIGSVGILLSGNCRLEVLDTQVRDFTNTGIALQPGFATTILIANTRVLNNANSAGIYVNATGQVSFTFDHVITANNNYGIFIDNSNNQFVVYGSIIDSIISENISGGFYNKGVTEISLENSTLRNLGVKSIDAEQGSFTSISHLYIPNSFNAVFINGGAVYSDGTSNMSLTAFPVTGGSLQPVTLQ